MAFFAHLAKIVAEYLGKGSQIYVEGKLQTRKWYDRDDHERYTTEIVAHEMKMLGGVENSLGRRRSETSGNTQSFARAVKAARILARGVMRWRREQDTSRQCERSDEDLFLDCQEFLTHVHGRGKSRTILPTDRTDAIHSNHVE